MGIHNSDLVHVCTVRDNVCLDKMHGGNVKLKDRQLSLLTEKSGQLSKQISNWEIELADAEKKVTELTAMIAKAKGDKAQVASDVEEICILCKD